MTMPPELLEFQDRIVAESTDKFFVLTPIVWMVRWNGEKVWNWSVALHTTGGVVIDAISSADEDLAESTRSSFLFALLQHRPSVCIDCDDELEAAKIMVARWPCEKTEHLYRGIAGERRANGVSNAHEQGS